VPPNFPEKIVEYVTEKGGRPVSLRELAEHFGCAERTCGRHAAKAKAEGELFQSKGGVVAWDGPMRLAELVRKQGSATAAEAAAALGIPVMTVRDHAKRAQARGLIRVESGNRAGYLPAEPQGTSAAAA
jgi:DeoR/GlpR family transcriptional regulator of sugar metabolism